MCGNINELYKATFIFTGKNRFNLFNTPIILEHLIETFILGFLARLPQKYYNFGSVYFHFIYFKEKIVHLFVSQFIYYILGFLYV